MMLMGVLATTAARHSGESTAAFAAAARAANIDSAVDLKQKDIAESVTFGLYEGATEQRDRVAALNVAAEDANAKSWRTARVIGVAAGAVVAGAWLLGRLRPKADVVVGALLAVSSVLLYLGVSTPMLSFINERDLPVLGHVVTEAQTKSVWGSAAALFDSGNAPVAVIIVLASMVIPAAKAALLAGVLVSRRLAAGDADATAAMAGLGGPRPGPVERRLLTWAKTVGRFSFVDLFIGAIFLSLFALRSFEGSTARAEPGLYYFAGYCVLSFVAGLLAWRSARPEWRMP